MTYEQDTNLAALEDMHRSAMQYLHERPPLDAVAMVTRVAFLLGEMRAPLRELRKALPPEAEGE